MSIVIVTGGVGYIGGQTVLQLKDAGHTVISVDKHPVPDHLRNIADRNYQEDFASEYALSLFDQFSPDAVVHCAGTSLVGPSVTEPARYYNNNFVKTKTMLDFLVERKAKTRVIFSSSAATYGEPIMVPCNEEDPALPISPYGESKLMIEWMLKSYHKAYGLDYVAFRYFNACGADPQARHGQMKSATHIIARVLEAIKEGREFTLNGNNYPTPDGTCIRDYIHVADIAKAHMMASYSEIPCDVYNLGTNVGASNREIIAMAEKVTGKKVIVNIGPMREGDPAVLTASADKFNNTSAWVPQYNLEEMVLHAWNWYNR